MLSRKWHDWRPIRAGNRIAMTVLGPQPAPLCRFKGVRGEIEIPPRFSLGGRGDILFSKENVPLASPYRTGTVPPGTPVIFSARRKENGHSWSKEKTLRDDLAPSCQITQNGGWPSRTADQIRKSPTGCAILKSQISAPPHLRAWSTTGCK